MNPVLTIDPEFEAKCPPLTEDELSQLEENILEEGLVLMPLIVWNDTIVDGHNRYRIAQAHPGIGFRTHEKQFNNRYEALSWICKNQLGRRNLTPQQKKYLIGQRYKAEKQTEKGPNGPFFHIRTQEEARMKAIITVVGPDRVGIIAEVCTLLAELHISVVEISQTIMEGTFTMIMLTQWTAGAPEFDVVQSRIAAKGDEMGLSIRMQRQDIFTAMHTI